MLLILSSFVVNSIYILTGHSPTEVIQGGSRGAKIKGTSDIWWEQTREDAVPTSTSFHVLLCLLHLLLVRLNILVRWTGVCFANPPS